MKTVRDQIVNKVMRPHGKLHSIHEIMTNKLENDICFRFYDFIDFPTTYDIFVIREKYK